MIEPMLCHDAHGLLENVPQPWSDWVMEEKLDGWRWQIVVGPEIIVVGTGETGIPKVRTYGGRNGKEHTGQTPELDRLFEWLPEGTVLDCELVTQSVGKSSDVAVKGSIKRVVVFDVLRLAGTDTTTMPLEARRGVCETIVDTIGKPVFVSMAAQGPVSQEAFEKYLAIGGEGVVCKKKGSLYRPGKRSRDWLKVKPQATTEATVIGYELGRGKGNQHKVGALKVRLHDTGKETSCGMDCSVQEYVDKFEGRIVELKHYGWTAHGKVRHPGYSRRRPDLETAA